MDALVLSVFLKLSVLSASPCALAARADFKDANFAPRPHENKDEQVPEQVSERASSCQSLSDAGAIKSCETGQKLFHDKSLSFDGQVACSSCHLPTALKGGRVYFDADGRSAPAVRGQELRRSRTPSLLDVGWKSELGHGARFFWNGRSASLQTSSYWPLFALDEMGASERTLAPHGGADQVAVDLGRFLQMQKSGPAAFDRYLTGDCQALSKKEQEGLKVYLEAGCGSCHQGQELLGHKPVQLVYASLPSRLFNPSEATYLADSELHGAPQKKVTLLTVPSSLRNLAQGQIFGRFGQFSTLESFIDHHCAQFPDVKVRRLCEEALASEKVPESASVFEKSGQFALLDFLRVSLLSEEFVPE